jgi:hypothetical protein
MTNEEVVLDDEKVELHCCLYYENHMHTHIPDLVLVAQSRVKAAASNITINSSPLFLVPGYNRQ